MSLFKSIKNYFIKEQMKHELGKIDNYVFLDYDGVINVGHKGIHDRFDNKEAIFCLNKLCLKYYFKIVVVSSWRNYPNYKELLYNSGLNPKIEIIGKTINSNQGREYEIKEYLKENPYFNKVIIIDDEDRFVELKRYLVKTDAHIGFNEEKYDEAVKKIKLM